MNRGAIFGGLAVASMLIACSGTDIDLGSRPQFSNGTAVVTILVQDGISRGDVAGATLTLRVGPHILTPSVSGNAYTFTNVPANATLPLVAQAAGYIDFAGTVATPAGGSLANPTYSTGLVLMYATTAVTQDYTVEVFDSATGAPVTGGQLVVSLETNPATDVTAEVTSTTAPAGNTLIVGSYGFHSATMVYALTGGAATIPGADLIFGATYNVQVIGATTAGGDYLVQQFAEGSNALNVPNTQSQITVFMAVGGGTPTVLSASNESNPATGADAAATNSTTAPLTVVFAEQVEDCSDPDDLDFVAADSVGLDGVANAASTNKDATMTFSALDIRHQVTLSSVVAEVWTTAPSAATTGVAASVIYDNSAKVRLVDDVGVGAACVSIVGLPIRGGAAVVSGAVEIFEAL